MVRETVRRVQLQFCLKRLPETALSVGFFFLRASPEAVPVPSGPEEAGRLLPACFETGVVRQNALHALERKLTHVFAPLLTAAGQRSEEAPPPSSAEPKDSAESRRRKLQRDELLISVQKFTAQVGPARSSMGKICRGVSGGFLLYSSCEVFFLF